MSELESILDEKANTLHAVAPEATVLTAVDAMCRSHVGALIVSKHGVTCGILSERDLMTRVLLQRLDPAATSVDDIMTVNVASIDLDSAVEDVCRVMAENQCRHIPVVKDGKTVGIVSLGDLVRWTTRSQAYELQTLREYLGGLCVV